MTDHNNADTDHQTVRPRRGCLCRIFRAAWRTCLAATVLYASAILIGLIPVNRGFRNAEQGIEVFVYADRAHSEIVVPAQTEMVDWREHCPPGDFRVIDEGMEYMAFGWGDRDFYIQTERWSDLRWGTTLKAMLLPTRTIVHVARCRRPQPSKWYRRVVLNREQYERLSRHIWTSFRLDETQRPSLIADTAYGDYDAFYEARGKYFFFNTCNSWTGRGLKRAGVRTGLWTSFAWGLLQVPQDTPPDDS